MTGSLRFDSAEVTLLLWGCCLSEVVFQPVVTTIREQVLHDWLRVGGTSRVAGDLCVGLGLVSLHLGHLAASYEFHCHLSVEQGPNVLDLDLEVAMHHLAVEATTVFRAWDGTILND